MSILLHGDCLELMKTLDDESVDLIFCDLPYVDSKGKGQTSCHWNQSAIDLSKFWIEVMRIKKLNTPIFMTTTTKFGVELINSCPKKCPFRYDIVWVKSAPAGFLSAKKMPMRKHEMIYVFYEKLPFYDLSSHKHKFIKERNTALPVSIVKEEKTQISKAQDKDLYGSSNGGTIGNVHGTNYDPPLPVSIVKEPEPEPESDGAVSEGYQGIHGDIKQPEYITNNISRNKLRRQYKKEGKSESAYDPPLPVSIVKEPEPEPEPEQDNNKDFSVDVKNSTYGTLQIKQPITSGPRWDPPLPVSVVKEETGGATGEEELCKYDVNKNTYGGGKEGRIKIPKDKKYHEVKYDPPLPVSIVKEDVYKANERFKNGKLTKHARNLQKGDDPIYDPPLPVSMLEIKSTRGKHSTEKPVALMSWILKYYSKEGDVILDPTMGSGSTGVSCKEMNRNFIGIEKDPEIYEVAVNRIEL